MGTAQMTAAIIQPKLIAAMLLVTFSALPISRTFQLWDPPPMVIMLGGFSALITLPIFIKLVMYNEESTTKLTYLSMFLTPFMFASAIDLVVSLENDGLISNYMLFYLQKGEPYLATPYSTAICYWDGVVHYLFYWAMLHDFHKGNACFRTVVLQWFGTFWISVVILMVGSISGPFFVSSAILLNIPYFVLPIVLLIWCVKCTDSNYGQPAVAQFSHEPNGVLVRSFFILFFIITTFVCLFRGLIALGANREILNIYQSLIEQPILHEHTYPKITMIVYLCWGVPFCCYAVWCLIVNQRTTLLIDLAYLFSGMAANCQVGYVGPYIISSAEDKLDFKNDAYWYVFWITNLLLFAVPHMFATYCYRLHSKSDQTSRIPKVSSRQSIGSHSYNTRSSRKQKTQ